MLIERIGIGAASSASELPVVDARALADLSRDIGKLSQRILDLSRESIVSSSASLHGGSEDLPSACALRAVIQSRRAREKFFRADLFADPAWDILLDLLLAHVEQTKVSVSSLCIAAAVPATTALRWITVMTEQKLLARKSDPKDGRRTFIELTDQTLGAMSEYFLQNPLAEPTRPISRNAW